MLPETVMRLATIDNIVGIKEASTLERIQRLVQEGSGNSFDVLSGEDGLAAEAILGGARGVISVTANVAPKAMHDLCWAALAGERDKALAIDEQLQPLHKALFLESNPIPVKWAVYSLGLSDTGIRLPLTPLTEHCKAELQRAMQQSGVL